MSEILVECEATEGMFSDEMVVNVGGREFIVPKSLVSTDSAGQSRIRAKLVQDDEGEWVILPTVYSDAINRERVTVVNA